MPFCDICHDHYFDGKLHSCDPFYECSENEGRSWCKVRARRHDFAAEKVAEKWDDDNAEGVTEHRVIWVRALGDDVVKKFDVTGEYTTTYSAEEI